MRALESVALVCGAAGQEMVQQSFVSTTLSLDGDNNTNSSVDTFTSSLLEDSNEHTACSHSEKIRTEDIPPEKVYPDENLTAAGSFTTASSGSIRPECRGGESVGKGEFTGFSDREGEARGAGGAMSFAIRVADAYSRNDSRTIVRREGAARVVGSALSLVRALLTDVRRWDPEGACGGEQNAQDGDGAPHICPTEFCTEQVTAC